MFLKHTKPVPASGLLNALVPGASAVIVMDFVAGAGGRRERYSTLCVKSLFRADFNLFDFTEHGPGKKGN